MGKLVSLSKELHKHLKVDPDKVEALGANLRMVPVMLSEFSRLVVQYPIVLTKNQETGQFVCVVLFGFETGENLFWQNGAWQGIYTPLNISRQPFFIGLDDQDSNQPLMCIDTESECLQSGEGEALFDNQGNETAYLTKMQSILAQLLDGEAKTQQFVRKLQQLELLTAVRLEITFANNESQRVEGVYTVDEKKMDALAQQDLIELHALGYLGPIYTLLASLGQIYALIDRKNTLLMRAADSD